MKDVALHTWRFEQSFSFDGCLCIGAGGGGGLINIYCCLEDNLWNGSISSLLFFNQNDYIQMRKVFYEKIFLQLMSKRRASKQQPKPESYLMRRGNYHFVGHS